MEKVRQEGLTDAHHSGTLRAVRVAAFARVLESRATALEL
jgi:hypothetical protein